jgi:hypothetical protein
MPLYVDEDNLNSLNNEEDIDTLNYFKSTESGLQIPSNGIKTTEIESINDSASE